MHNPRLFCEVLEVPRGGGRRRKCGWPRDLLPWADPYIARLIRRLEERYGLHDDYDPSDPFVADDAPFQLAACDDGWEEDAFDPRPAEPAREAAWYGGFPLLEDVS